MRKSNLYDQSNADTARLFPTGDASYKFIVYVLLPLKSLR